MNFYHLRLSGRFRENGIESITNVGFTMASFYVAFLNQNASVDHQGNHSVCWVQYRIIVDDGSQGFRCIRLSTLPQRYPYFDKVMIELQQDWQKRQAVRCCRLIKEELMMNRWHPDRVEKLLELGILDDLD